MGSFRDRYLKGKKTKARKYNPAVDTNRAAMRGPGRSRSVSERSEDARRAEETYVFDEPAAFGEDMESIVVRPKDVVEELSSAPGYMESVFEEEYDPRFLGESTTALGRQQETNDIRTFLNTTIRDILSIQPAYEESKSRYEEAVAADRKFLAGDTSLTTLRLRDELPSRKAIFEKEDAIYSPKVALRDNLEAALKLAPTVVQSKSILEQQLNEQQSKRDRNTADRNVVEKALKKLSDGVTNYTTQETATAVRRKELALNETRRELLDESTKIMQDTTKLGSMYSALTGGGATDIIQPLGPDEKESIRYERNEEQEERLRKLDEYQPGQYLTSDPEDSDDQLLAEYVAEPNISESFMTSEPEEMEPYIPSTSTVTAPPISQKYAEELSPEPSLPPAPVLAQRSSQEMVPEASSPYVPSWVSEMESQADGSTMEAYEDAQRRRRSVTDPIDPILIESMREGYDTSDPSTSAYLSDTGSYRR